MRKTFKKKTVAFVMVAMTVLSLNSGNVYADESKTLEDYYELVIEKDNLKFCITDGVLEYVAPDREDMNVEKLVVPEEAKELGELPFHDIKVGKLVLHKDIRAIDGHMRTHFDCEEVQVEEGNEVYASVDGVLYSKDLTKLLGYPSYKQDKTYAVLESVVEIDMGACIFNNTYLQKIQFGSNVKEGYMSMVYCSNLKEIYVPDNEALADDIVLQDEQVLCKTTMNPIVRQSWGNYVREYELMDVKDNVYPDGWRHSLLGDVDGNGMVELSDAQQLLRAAVLLTELDAQQLFVGSFNGIGNEVSITDAQSVLRAALLLGDNSEKNKVLHPNKKTMYESIEFGRWGANEEEHLIFTNKEDLLEAVQTKLNNEELEAYIESLDEDFFNIQSVILTTMPVHGDDLDDIQIKDVGMKSTATCESVYVEVEDNTGGVLTKCNQYYAALTVMNKVLESEEPIQIQCVNHKVEGSKKIKVNAWYGEFSWNEEQTILTSKEELDEYLTELVEINRFGRDATASELRELEKKKEQWIDELMKKLPTDMQEMLNKDEAFFEHSLLVIDTVGAMDVIPFDRIKVNYYKDYEDGYILRVNASFEHYVEHSCIALCWAPEHMVIMEIEKELLKDCQLDVQSSGGDVYADYTPEQETFAIEPVVSSEAVQYGALVVKDEAQREEIMEILKNLFTGKLNGSDVEEPDEEYKRLVEKIKQTDLSQKELILVFSWNEYDMGEGYDEEPMYVTVTPDNIGTHFVYWAYGYPVKKQLVTVLELEDGTIQNRAEGCNQAFKDMLEDVNR